MLQIAIDLKLLGQQIVHFIDDFSGPYPKLAKQVHNYPG